MGKTAATICGFVAIVLWAATMGVSRLLAESLGKITTPAAVYTIGGVLGCLWFYRKRSARAQLAGMSLKYLLGGGVLFTVYSVCLYLAIGMAATRQQVFEVTVLNYLWPGLTLVLSIPLLGKRPRPLFPVGVLLAFTGVALAVLPEGGWDAAAFAANLRRSAAIYALAFGAAFLWAAYSNLIRLWAGPRPGGGIPLFILATGLIMWVVRTQVDESSRWSLQTLAITAFMGIGPALLAYVFWDIAMRRGHLTFAASCAYLTPVLSTVVSCLVLGLVPPLALWIGCGLVVAGAVLCKLCLRG